MAEQLQEVRQITPDGTTATRTTRIVDNDTVAATPADARTNLAARIIWFIAGVILTLLAFRFVLVLLGANPANGFVNFIYTLSHPFAAPFFGIFGYKLQYGISRVELSTIVAMVVYAVIAYGLSRLFTLGDRHNRTA